MKDLTGKCLIEIGNGCAGCYEAMYDCKEVADKFGLRFVELDMESDYEQVKAFEVDRVPTIILSNDGKIIARCSGYQPTEILELWVEAKLENN
ncbi:MAG: thioredoxin domain-containing protein [Candidatus Coproplasma sp.]